MLHNIFFDKTFFIYNFFNSLIETKNFRKKVSQVQIF